MSFRSRYLQELERIGLDEAMCPFGGMASTGNTAEEEFLSHLRQLAAGATWRESLSQI